MHQIRRLEVTVDAGQRDLAGCIPVASLGLAASTFLAISFAVCVVGYLLLPSLPIAHGALSMVLPGFQLLTWPSFFLGLVESAAWGWYFALVFGPLYNFFVARRR